MEFYFIIFHARQVKRLICIHYKIAKYGLIIHGTLIKIEFQHSASNTMTFIISQRDRSCVPKFYSAQRFFLSSFMSIRIVRCTDAAMIRPVVRHFLIFKMFFEGIHTYETSISPHISSKQIQMAFSFK